MYPTEYLYSEDHEWLHVKDDVITIGITAYAQNELGEVVYVDLPEVGDELESGDAFGAIDSSKTSADVYSPVAGEVVAVNEDLEEAPETVNEDPHGKGWLIKVRFSSSEGLDSLIKAQQYEELIEGQS
ncbi:MAG: glycine cleavage system protein GcvH [Acidobacteriota bacterium]